MSAWAPVINLLARKLLSMRFALAAILTTLLLAAATTAQDDAPDPQDAARLENEAAERRAESERLETAAALEQQEIERLQYRLVEAARVRNDSERAALAVDARLGNLSTEETELLARIDEDRDALADVFAALARIERARPPAFFAHGRNTLDAARAASLLAEVAPQLDARAVAAIERLQALQILRGDIAVQQVALSDSEARLDLRRTEIIALIAERTDRLVATRALARSRARESEQLAARAANLRQLIEELERRASAFTPRVRPSTSHDTARPIPRLKPTPDAIGIAQVPYASPTGRFADARGTLGQPVAGRIVSLFGQARETGPDQGIVIRTRRRAQVTSPFDARVEYSDAFSDYGQLVILNVGDDYYIVLAGFSSVYVVAGQTLLAGEPIGEMSAVTRPPADLYVEFRRDGEPIDPSPWLRGGG